jgi:predicted HD superfamily hydrolase involved in NAD metabolism
VLADRFGEDPYRAIAAALFHDSGRLPTLEEVASEMHRRGIEVPDEFQAYPKLWHALLSEHRAKHDFGIRDEGVLRAIRIHSTGDADMTRLDRILFVSDYIEPMRNFEGLNELRELAHRDLDAAFRRAIEKKLGYIRSQNRPLHPLSAKALEAAEPDPE